MNGNKYGSVSEIRLTAVKGKERSFLKESSFTAPFKILPPFYDESGRMQVMLISVSAGIMAGDRQNIWVQVGEEAAAEISSQSYEKIHKMDDGGEARRQTDLTVKRGGLLVYAPLPAIPFAGSAFVNNTDIHLEDQTSRLIYGEIISCGRAARGERFDYRYYKALTRVYQAGRLIYNDNSVYQPEEMEMEGLCMFEGYTHLSNLLLVNIPVSKEQEEQLQEEIGKLANAAGGLTRTGSGAVCIRVLARQAEVLVEFHQRVKDITAENSYLNCPQF